MVTVTLITSELAKTLQKGQPSIHFKPGERHSHQIFSQITHLFNPYKPGNIEITLEREIANFDQVFDCDFVYIYNRNKCQRRKAGYQVNVIYEFQVAAAFKSRADRDLAKKHLSLP